MFYGGGNFLRFQTIEKREIITEENHHKCSMIHHHLFCYILLGVPLFHIDCSNHLSMFIAFNYQRNDSATETPLTNIRNS